MLLAIAIQREEFISAELFQAESQYDKDSC